MFFGIEHDPLAPCLDGGAAPIGKIQSAIDDLERFSVGVLGEVFHVNARCNTVRRGDDNGN